MIAKQSVSSFPETSHFPKKLYHYSRYGQFLLCCKTYLIMMAARAFDAAPLSTHTNTSFSKLTSGMRTLAEDRKKVLNQIRASGELKSM